MMHIPDGRLVIVGAQRVQVRSSRSRVRITLQELFLIWLGGRITSPRVWFGAGGQGVTLKLAWGPSNSSPWNSHFDFDVSSSCLSFLIFWSFCFLSSYLLGPLTIFQWYGFGTCELLSPPFLLSFSRNIDVMYFPNYFNLLLVVVIWTERCEVCTKTTVRLK